MKPNSALCGRIRVPVRFGAPGRGTRHQRRQTKPRPLLGQCDPVVNKQGQPNQPKKRIPSPSPFRGGASSFWGENQTRPGEALCAVRGRGRETTPGKPPTGPVGGRVSRLWSESEGSGHPQAERKLVSSPLRKRRLRETGDRQKRKKQALPVRQRQRIEARD